MSDVEGKRVEMMEKVRMEVERVPFFYTRATGQFQQNPLSKRLDHASVLKKAI